MAGSQLRSTIGKDSFARIELSLLNKATKIDSNYLKAYFNKFVIQYTLRKYADALENGKEMVRLAPKDAMIKFIVGKAYDKTGDTIRAKAYYKEYLYYCDGKLAFMPKDDKEREEMEFQKALTLILLNETKQGRDILFKLYTGSKNGDFNRDKDLYGFYMGLTRADLLEAKDTSITNGNTTMSINTFFP